MDPAAAVEDQQQLFYAKLAVRIGIMHMHACICRCWLHVETNIGALQAAAGIST
jgi:hypothetical protein